ncbi:hypothetical protein [Wolbachia endosymbiont of Drosophila tsacasi]|uniref:hypothetical protein n=1 Tax=Wolbachia endosymbiont of Drosophila tsacasi TaxID=3002579 RepID=UPI0023A98B49|nr:hypothetical protein [Wolbachia endosymbiont of Drosophila tsacasi]MDE5062303.1 hypothetical protein [Wolbachia endosymbiont of Drosophila tsacasi]
MEKELRAYAENNKTDIEKTYQSVNSKAKKIMISEKVMNMSPYPFVISVIVFFIGAIACAPPPRYARRAGYIHDSTAETYVMVIVLSLIAMSFVIAGIAYLVNEHYKQSFLKEMENFIEEPRHMDKATNTENGEEPKQQEQEVEENLIDLSDDQTVAPSAPPWEEVSNLYPNLSQLVPSEDYKALCEIEPSSNPNSILSSSNIETSELESLQGRWIEQKR